MAERDFLPVVFVCLGVVEGLSLAIAAVFERWLVWEVGGGRRFLESDNGCEAV